MDISTYFIENKALFGPYPTDEDANYFEKIGVRYFVDLTEMNKLPPYNLSPESTLIKFPIPDMKVPTDSVQFSSLVIYLDNLLKKSDGENYKLYVHCRGGNGRVGILVASLLTRYRSISVDDALQLTQHYHSERKNLKVKWKLIGSPQTIYQKNFVKKLFTPFCFYKDVLFGNKYGFVPHAKIPLVISGLLFNDSYSAYKHVIQNTPSSPDVYNCMKCVQSIKLQQCPPFLDNLLHTNLRPIMYCNNYDKYWGIDKTGDGNNYLGQILTKLRDEILLERFVIKMKLNNICPRCV